MVATDTSPEPARQAPMYASWLVFKGFLDWLKEMPAIPEQLDRSLAADRYSGSGWSHLMSGLQFLGLTDGARPRPELEALVKADKEARKALLEATLRRAYGDDFLDRVPKMTPNMFDKRLDDLGATAATRRKAASFLTQAMKAAEVEVPPAISKRARNRPSITRRNSNNKKQNDPKVQHREPELTTTPLAQDEITAHPTGGFRNVRRLALGGDVEVTLGIQGDMLTLPVADQLWLVKLSEAFEKHADMKSSQGDKKQQEA